MNEKSDSSIYELSSSLSIQRPVQKFTRFSGLIWGSAGCGKTTLASTAPGLKLWLSFDDQATTPIMTRDDIIEVPLFDKANNIVERFKDQKDMLGLEKFFKSEEGEAVETVVFDSLTTFGEKALFHGVDVARGTPKGRGATIEDPGFSGYGNKNTWTRLLVINLLRLTHKYNKHCIFIAHEDKPTTNDQGAVLFISIMLGSALNEQVGLQINEIWWLNDTGKDRRIAIRPCRMRKPMKTRMFSAMGSAEFLWDYNAETLKGDGIAEWYEAWKAGGYAKLPVPTKGGK